MSRVHLARLRAIVRACQLLALEARRAVIDVEAHAIVHVVTLRIFHKAAEEHVVEGHVCDRRFWHDRDGQMTTNMSTRTEQVAQVSASFGVTSVAQ